MLDEKLVAAINHQIQHEFNNQFIYLGMSIWFEKEVLKGFAAWFGKQASEEHGHAMRFIKYMQDKGARIALNPVEASKTDYASALEAFKAARNLERGTTGLIHKLYELATELKDPATQNMLQWFIAEQVEEENWTDEYVTMAEKIGASVGSLYMFDHHVGKKAKGE